MIEPEPLPPIKNTIFFVSVLIVVLVVAGLLTVYGFVLYRKANQNIAGFSAPPSSGSNNNLINGQDFVITFNAAKTNYVAQEKTKDQDAFYRVSYRGTAAINVLIVGTLSNSDLSEPATVTETSKTILSTDGNNIISGPVFGGTSPSVAGNYVFNIAVYNCKDKDIAVVIGQACASSFDNARTLLSSNVKPLAQNQFKFAVAAAKSASVPTPNQSALSQSGDFVVCNDINCMINAASVCTKARWTGKNPILNFFSSIVIQQTKTFEI